MGNAETETARLRHDYKRLADAYKALSARHHDGKRPCERETVTSYDPADWPYPREWEVEDGELRERAEQAEAKLAASMGALKEVRIVAGHRGAVRRIVDPALAAEPPASKRYRAIEKAAEAWSPEGDCGLCAHRTTRSDGGDPIACRLCKAVRGEGGKQ